MFICDCVDGLHSANSNSAVGPTVPKWQLLCPLDLLGLMEEGHFHPLPMNKATWTVMNLL